MALPILRADALRRTDGGFTLLLNLPWIRSLPLASLQDLEVSIDGERAEELDVVIGGERLSPAQRAASDRWWFLQDRLAVVGTAALSPGAHRVAVRFRLLIPYLPGGPDAPLVLPFTADAALTAGASALPASSWPSPADRSATLESSAALPAGWELAASAFNWTPETIRADRSAADVAVGVARDVAPLIEIEAGQVWPSFPTPAGAEIDALNSGLAAVGGTVSIVGASVDDWRPDGRRRDDAERLAFVLPQLRAASRVGARGVRLPLGQAGRPLLERLASVLEDLDLVWFEEAQGHQTPDADPAAYATIADLGSPRIRVLLDISMLMPALPVTYLERMRAEGLDPRLLARLESDWREPGTHAAVLDALRSGHVPPSAHTLFMNLLVRFGRSRAAELRDVLPLVAGVHLKFWDLDDADGRISDPIGDIGRELRATGFAGTLCSEWGGHEWLDADPTAMTTAHLSLATRALAAE